MHSTSNATSLGTSISARNYLSSFAFVHRSLHSPPPHTHWHGSLPTHRFFSGHANRIACRGAGLHSSLWRSAEGSPSTVVFRLPEALRRTRQRNGQVSVKSSPRYRDCPAVPISVPPQHDSRHPPSRSSEWLPYADSTGKEQTSRRHYSVRLPDTLPEP
jgi:hypothetical protein